MCSETTRRLVAIVLSVALATGMAVRSVQAIAMELAAPAATAAATTDSDMPMSGTCSGCAGDENAMTATCSVLCSGVVVLPPVAVVFQSVAAATVAPGAAPAATGHTAPPDPYPPRPIVLS